MRGSSRCVTTTVGVSPYGQPISSACSYVRAPSTKQSIAAAPSSAVASETPFSYPSPVVSIHETLLSFFAMIPSTLTTTCRVTVDRRPFTLPPRPENRFVPHLAEASISKWEKFNPLPGRRRGSDSRPDPTPQRFLRPTVPSSAPDGSGLPQLDNSETAV
jgi:hypothetical protein